MNSTHSAIDGSGKRVTLRADPEEHHSSLCREETLYQARFRIFYFI